MRIVIAGGSGFLGRPLAEAFAAEGHDVAILSRHSTLAGWPPGVRCVQWAPGDPTGSWMSAIDGAAAVVNLAGESIAGRRWSAAHKQRILDSRIEATRSLVDAMRRAAAPPATLVSGSAVGYYGALGDDLATEDTPPGSDFLARVCVQWEAEANRATRAATRVVCIRTGLVLAKDGGALQQMLLPFKLGFGGRLGSGRQYWPWIHRDDWVELVRWAVQRSEVTGALNATAPSPVTNADFTRALGRALNRPTFLPAPAFALRLLLGEMADLLLLSGQRAVPARAERLGFKFRYATLDDALHAIFT